MKKVVIVESPSKAKTINRYLGSDYVVLASYGHIRDLPSRNGSVKPEENFEMLWEVDDRSHKHIDDIAKAVKNADEVYLATDPDREGEAISWHVQQILQDRGVLGQKKIYRIVFHEITKTAIQNALKAPRPINQELVDAYLARRSLDYLVGFNLSPVLWRKLPGSRSAGRVQSVALRLIVERETAIESFVNQEYWSVLVDLKTQENQQFSARLTHVNGAKLDKFDLTCERDATAACDQISARSYAVSSVEKKQVRRFSAAPFITSTLQQEASRKLGFGASRTMQVAQRLYEGFDIGGEVTGLITYMRTDSVHIAQEAVTDIRGYIKETYGDAYLPASQREFKNKSKNAQEAHEAIRPTSVRRHPKDVAKYLDDAQLRLYELIWKRTVASQMENALFDQVGVDVTSPDQQVILRATGSTLVFDGFLKLYKEGVDDAAPDDDAEKLLPKLAEKDPLGLVNVNPNQHFTQPPPRYSEASLVKKMEELGIGRPSTYASIIHVLQERNYVKLEKKQFIPEERGRLVTSFLANFFQKYVEYDFTAQLEEQLDDVSEGKRQWKDVLSSFWTAFIATIDATKMLRITEVLDCLERDLSVHLFHGADESERTCPTCKEGRVGLKLSRFGAFLGCSRYPDCKYTRQLSGEAGNADDAMLADEPKLIGKDPENGADITLRKGPYGYYLQWEGLLMDAAPPPPSEPDTVEDGEKPKKRKKKAAEPKPPKPKRVSIPAATDPHTVDLAAALKLRDLPKRIGVHPETGNPLTVSIGRFGPYIKHGDMFVSIPKAYDMFAVTVEIAVDLIEAKKNAPPRKGAGKAPAKKADIKKTAVKKTVAKKAAPKKAAPKKNAE